MIEEPGRSNSNHEGLQPKGGDFQYQHQTVTLDNTIGLVLMSILAFALLVALLRKQARCDELAAQSSGRRVTPLGLRLSADRIGPGRPRSPDQ